MANDLTPLIVTAPAVSGTGSGLITEDKRPVVLKAIAPVVLILVRAAKTFVDTLLGSAVITQFAPNVLGDFGSGLKVAVIVSGVAAGVTAGRTISELLGKLDQKFPTLTA